MNDRLMSGRMPAILVLVGALSSIALLWLFAFAPDLRDDASSGNDAASRSAVGFAGLEKLLALSGVQVEIDRGATATRPSLTILTPDQTSNAREVQRYQAQGPILIILPKWRVYPVLLHTGWVAKAGIIGALPVQKLIPGKVTLRYAPGDVKDAALHPSGTAVPGLPQRLSGSIEELQTIYSGGTPLLRLTGANRFIARSKEGVPVLARMPGNSPVYVLSEPDLMNNHGLADESTALAAVAIIRALRQGGGPVMLDVTLNGLGRSPSLLRALFEPPLRGATICACLAALLMALHALARFGAAQSATRVFARGKKSLADNTAGLVRMMGREGAMAIRYVRGAREMALARLGAQRGNAAEQEALLAAIERKAGVEGRYASLAQEAAWAKNGSDLIDIAARTYAWREKITSGH